MSPMFKKLSPGDYIPVSLLSLVWMICESLNKTNIMKYKKNVQTEHPHTCMYVYSNEQYVN